MPRDHNHCLSLDKGKEVFREDQMIESNSMDRDIKVLPNPNGSCSHVTLSPQLHPTVESGCPIESPDNEMTYSAV